jgi:hypothetical protein
MGRKRLRASEFAKPQKRRFRKGFIRVLKIRFTLPFGKAITIAAIPCPDAFAQIACRRAGASARPVSALSPISTRHMVAAEQHF